MHCITFPNFCIDYKCLKFNFIEGILIKWYNDAGSETENTKELWTEIIRILRVQHYTDHCILYSIYIATNILKWKPIYHSMWANFISHIRWFEDFAHFFLFFSFFGHEQMIGIHSEISLWFHFSIRYILSYPYRFKILCPCLLGQQRCLPFLMLHVWSKFSNNI